MAQIQHNAHTGQWHFPNVTPKSIWSHARDSCSLLMYSLQVLSLAPPVCHPEKVAGFPLVTPDWAPSVATRVWTIHNSGLLAQAAGAPIAAPRMAL